LFDKKTCLWRVVGNPSAAIITNIQTRIDESKQSLLSKKLATDDAEEKKKYTKYEAQYIEFYKQVGKGAYTNQIIKILQDYLFDGDFERQLDTTPYEVAYRNGIYDLRVGKFRAGLMASDRLTQTIPFDYEKPSEADVAIVKQELKKICNNDDQHLDYYLSSLGYSMTGDASLEQLMNNIRGQKACNGKSVVFDALMGIIPNYIVELEQELFDINFGQIHKSVAGWKGKRIAYLNEMSRRKKNESLLKKVADGTSIPYKVMYGTMDTMPITFKLFIVGNHTMKVDADGGIGRRLRMMQFDSDFVTDLAADDPENCRFVKDINFGNLLQTTYKHALLAVIFEYSTMYATEGRLRPYPKAWADESADVVRDNNQFEDYFNDQFVVDPAGVVCKRVMTETLAGYKGGVVNIKDELKKMRITYTYDYKGRVKGETVKGVYVGFKLSPPPAVPSDDLPDVQCQSNSCDTTAEMSDLESEVELVET
jgi:phage/plasmid-associated DNA primase